MEREKQKIICYYKPHIDSGREWTRLYKLDLGKKWKFSSKKANQFLKFKYQLKYMESILKITHTNTHKYTCIWLPLQQWKYIYVGE